MLVTKKGRAPMRDVDMKQVMVIVVALHALIHFMGAAKGFGWARLEQLKLPVSLAAAWGWTGAGLALLAFVGLALARPPSAVIVGVIAALLSQLLIARAWSDAKWGTIGNVVVLLFAAWLFAAHGPWSLRARFEHELSTRAKAGASELLTESHLVSLPDPVARYVRHAGALGRPRPLQFSVQLRGRIRGGPNDSWMEFESRQTNLVEGPTRLFFMSARKAGLPVDVLHAFVDGQASMDVRLASLVPLAHEAGAELTRAETVTLLNDLCLFAPGALASSRITWTEVDERHAIAHYTLGAHRVSALLTFNERDELVDFQSEDRLRRNGSGAFSPLPWSTPIERYGRFGGLHLIQAGRALWHEPGGAYPYLEIEVIGYEAG